MTRDGELPPALLDYVPWTVPTPIVVTVGATPATASITLAVDVPVDDTVFCDEIDVIVPVGPDARDAFEQRPDAAVVAGPWTLASMTMLPAGTHHLGAGDAAQYVFQPRSTADWEITYPLSFQLSGTVNRAPGAFLCQVVESSGPSESALEWRQAAVPLAKVQPSLLLESFVAYRPGDPTNPCLRFANGAPIRLAWESNATWFKLFAGDSPVPVYSGAATWYELTGGLAVDTTFTLVASLSLGPEQTWYRTRTVTVAISDPDLTPRTVSATGKVSSMSLSTTTVDADTVTTTGRATVAALTVNTDAGMSSATLSGSLTVGATATVSGRLVVNRGQVALVGFPEPLVVGQPYIAPTDGMIVGQIDGKQPGDAGTIGVAVGTGTYVIKATGGYGAAQNLMTPVAGGFPFKASMLPSGGNPMATFWYIPFGFGIAADSVGDEDGHDPFADEGG